MRYYVFHDKGRCNDGDHDSGLASFETLENARKLKAEIESRNFSREFGDECVIIRGEEIE